jgi:hypothetical protein
VKTRVWSIFFLLLTLLSLRLTRAATYYVWTNSPLDGPGTNWATAFHILQDAVDVTADNDTVLVTNGVYDVGATLTPDGTLSNRVTVTNAILLQSVNGPEATFIVGVGPWWEGPVMRCVYLCSNSALCGFTLSVVLQKPA